MMDMYDDDNTEICFHNNTIYGQKKHTNYNLSLPDIGPKKSQSRLSDSNLGIYTCEF